jgi:hypothetical protein
MSYAIVSWAQLEIPGLDPALMPSWSDASGSARGEEASSGMTTLEGGSNGAVAVEGRGRVAALEG